MALIKCPDCGRPVSDLAFACPQCARPIAYIQPPRASRLGDAESARAAGPGAPASSLPDRPIGDDLPALPIIDGWLRDLRKARELPGGTKLCDRCGTDVSVAAFRRNIGPLYLCFGCAQEDEARNHARRAFLMKVVGAILLASAVATGAVYVAKAVAAYEEGRAD
jgi:hypothetical protein